MAVDEQHLNPYVCPLWHKRGANMWRSVLHALHIAPQEADWWALVTMQTLVEA